jgi:myo-inositol-1(or 4)-monophosphatase
LPAVNEIHSADISADLALLVDAAQEAGQIALRYFKNDPEVWMKDGTSPVSEADYAVDAFLRETLLAARPDYGWLSEETIDSAARLSARRTFVVDPIDGTRGFLEGSSRWCVSVAVVELGNSVAGVLECPARKETFAAKLGGGAFRNDVRVMTGAIPENPKIGGPKDLFDALPNTWRDRSARAGYIPSIAYRIALVADGSLDASFVKPNSHDWDLAAADLILHEAGGSLLDARGRRLSFAGAEIRHGALVAGSGELLATMSGVIAERYG